MYKLFACLLYTIKVINIYMLTLHYIKVTYMFTIFFVYILYYKLYK